MDKEKQTNNKQPNQEQADLSLSNFITQLITFAFIIQLLSTHSLAQ